ncbi:type IV secretion system protein [Bombella intestini]|uniref:type IV secretion system protein n=1 Tax=Bombella intestini TaxID=1539051 RepID=UPI0009879C27|nr:type IV secretion system protein [Bombella intestini]
MRIYARDIFEVVNDQIVLDFDNKMNVLVSKTLGALAAPFSALIVLWVIVTGILVMRGDIDVRRGITRIIRVALVSAFILEAGVYNTYVVQFFRNGLPTWIASTITSGQALSTPELLDDIMASLSGSSAAIKAILSVMQVSDHQKLAIVDTCNGLMLGEVFTIYLCAQVVMDVVLTIGPFVIAGFLFEATRGFAERWIGQMVGLILLSAMVDISVMVFAQGITHYLSQVGVEELVEQGLGAVATGALFNATIFVMICASIVNLLPAIAAIIGGGIEVRSAGSAMSSVVGGSSSGSRMANNIARRMFK